MQSVKEKEKRKIKVSQKDLITILNICQILYKPQISQTFTSSPLLFVLIRSLVYTLLFTSESISIFKF